MADRQISPGNAHSPSRLYLPHLRPHFPCRYGALKILAFSPSVTASYALSVRQASALPAASSGFHLAADTLAVRLTVPPAGSVGDLHPQVSAPCRAHNTKTANPDLPGFAVAWTIMTLFLRFHRNVRRHAQHEVGAHGAQNWIFTGFVKRKLPRVAGHHLTRHDGKLLFLKHFIRRGLHHVVGNLILVGKPHGGAHR